MNEEVILLQISGDDKPGVGQARQEDSTGVSRDLGSPTTAGDLWKSGAKTRYRPGRAGIAHG